MSAWLARPLFGWGIGSFDWAYNYHRTDYAALFPSMRTILSQPMVLAGSAHNVVVQTLAELGLVGLCLMGAVLAAVLKRARGMCRAALILGLGTMLVGFPEQNPNTAVLLVIAAGIAARA